MTVSHADSLETPIVARLRVSVLSYEERQCIDVRFTDVVTELNSASPQGRVGRATAAAVR